MFLLNSQLPLMLGKILLLRHLLAICNVILDILFHSTSVRVNNLKYGSLRSLDVGSVCKTYAPVNTAVILKRVVVDRGCGKHTVGKYYSLVVNSIDYRIEELYGLDCTRETLHLDKISYLVGLEEQNKHSMRRNSEACRSMPYRLPYRQMQRWR